MTMNILQRFRSKLGLSDAGIFSPLFYHAAKHVYRFITEPEYRRYCWLTTRYGRTPRYVQRKIRLHQWTLSVPDVASFLSAYREIFVEEIYAFPARTSGPLILDCGANIGLSVLYLKQKYPQARIVAYEADPHIFGFLKHNLLENGVSDVELVNQAVWSSDTTVTFNREGADGGRIDSGQSENNIRIPAVSLASILERQHFDFVKIDIEGAETEAFRGCEHLIENLNHVFIEFHSIVGKRQDLGWLINTFELHGFRVHVHPPLIAKKPFLGIQCAENGMDMQLNLFFWKDTGAIT